MGVAGEADQTLAKGQGGLENPFTLNPVAVPGVEVVRDLGGLGEESLLRRREAGETGAGGQLLQRGGVLIKQAGVAGIEQQFGRDGHRLHQHLLPQHLPAGAGGGHALLQPGKLISTDQVTAGISPGLLHGGDHQLLGHQRCQRFGKSRDGRRPGRRCNPKFSRVGEQIGRFGQDGADAGLHGGGIGVLQLLIPGGEAGFQYVQRQNIAEAEGAVALGERGEGGSTVTGLP